MERDSDFTVAVDFNGASSPRRVFTALSHFLEALESLDALLIKSVAPNIKCSYQLQSVQSGSLLVKLKTFLESTEDEELKKGNLSSLIGTFLIQAKYACLEYLNRHNGLGRRSELMELADSVHMIAMQSSVSRLHAYSKPSLNELGKEAGKISSSLRYLEEGESVRFQTRERQTSLTRKMLITAADLESLLVEREITNSTEMILKVRKPDFLGSSQWEFRYNGQKISASINDASWLGVFLNGKQDFRPGVSLLVKCDQTVKYGYDGEVFAEDFNIKQIIDVIPKQEQFRLA